jgi:trigger factor
MRADPAKVREAIEEIAATYESPDEVINWYYGNEEQLSAVESSVLEDQAFDFLLAQAKVTEQQVSYEDVIKAESAKPAAAQQGDSESPSSES